VQPALQVELDQPRHVGAEAVRSHHAALDAALAQEVDAVQLDLGADRDHADQRRRAARAQRREALLAVALRPMHSNEYWTPPPVSSTIA
jgi:hypothetical protein